MEAKNIIKLIALILATVDILFVIQEVSYNILENEIENQIKENILDKEQPLTSEDKKEYGETEKREHISNKALFFLAAITIFDIVVIFSHLP